MAADTTNADPYFVFREEMLRKLERVDEQLEVLKRVASEPLLDPKTYTLRLKDAKKELKKTLRDAESTLGDLATCVKLMQQQQQQASMDEREIYNRTSLVQSCRNRISQAKQGMNQVVPRGSSSRRIMPDNSSNNNSNSVGLLSGEATYPAGASSSPRQSGGYAHLDDQDGSSSSMNGSNNPQIQASLLMQHQDETLDVLDAAVTRVGYMADTIHEEIGDQNKMLQEMETDLEEAEEQLGMVMGKLSEFLGTKDRFQLCTIVILFAIAVVLLMLIVYT